MRIAIRNETDAQMRAHASDTYPHECCGVVVDRAGREEVNRITNVQDQQHRIDPEKFPRTARTAYFMEPKELLRVIRDVDDNNLRIHAFYHSHPDHDAYFSEEDKRQALIFDEPIYPDAAWIVLSVRKGIVQTTKAFGWDADKRDFVEIDLMIQP